MLIEDSSTTAVTEATHPLNLRWRATARRDYVARIISAPTKAAVAAHSNGQFSYIYEMEPPAAADLVAARRAARAVAGDLRRVCLELHSVALTFHKTRARKAPSRDAFIITLKFTARPLSEGEREAELLRGGTEEEGAPVGAPKSLAAAAAATPEQ